MFFVTLPSGTGNLRMAAVCCWGRGDQKASMHCSRISAIPTFFEQSEDRFTAVKSEEYIEAVKISRRQRSQNYL